MGQNLTAFGLFVLPSLLFVERLERKMAVLWTCLLERERERERERKKSEGLARIRGLWYEPNSVLISRSLSYGSISDCILVICSSKFGSEMERRPSNDRIPSFGLSRTAEAEDGRALYMFAFCRTGEA